MKSWSGGSADQMSFWVHFWYFESLQYRSRARARNTQIVCIGLHFDRSNVASWWFLSGTGRSHFRSFRNWKNENSFEFSQVDITIAILLLIFDENFSEFHRCVRKCQNSLRNVEKIKIAKKMWKFKIRWNLKFPNQVAMFFRSEWIIQSSP